MSDSSNNASTPQSEPAAASTPSSDTSAATQAASLATDRTQLLQTARSFLNSPHVRHEGTDAKREFLAQKGLNEVEIKQLLHISPTQAPLIPPRTYPQLPQSNLPNLLVGLFRIATWIAGGSAVVLLAYFRFIYPRIAQSFQARHALRTHQKELLKKLTASIEQTKAEQSASFALLPTPEPYKEDSTYVEYKTLDDILVSAKDPNTVPDVTLLRCAIQDVVASKQPVTAAAIFSLLEGKMPWSNTEQAEEIQTRLWETLSSCPLFMESPSTSDSDATVWSYQPPTPLPAPPLVSALSSLKDALPTPSTSPRTKYQNTLQSLTDLTGYITTQIYAMPVGSVKYTSTGVVSALSPDEEEIRREIRSLKGLVLNRKSFMPPRLTTPNPPVR